MKRLLITVTAAFLMLTLSACGFLKSAAGGLGNKTSAQMQMPDEGTTEHAVWEQIPEPVDPAEAVNDAEQQGFTIAQQLSQMGSYRVIEEEKDYCVMEVTAPDMRKAFERAEKRLAKEEKSVENYHALVEQMLAGISEDLENGKIPYVTTEVRLDVVDGDPVLTAEFYNALYGGLLSVISEANEEFTGGGAQ